MDEDWGGTHESRKQLVKEEMMRGKMERKNKEKKKKKQRWAREKRKINREIGTVEEEWYNLSSIKEKYFIYLSHSAKVINNLSANSWGSNCGAAFMPSRGGPERERKRGWEWIEINDIYLVVNLIHSDVSFLYSGLF